MTDLAEKIARVIAARDYARDRRNAGNPLQEGETLWDKAPQIIGEYWSSSLKDTTELTSAILALLEPEGWQLVPKNPTSEMIRVGTDARWASAIRSANNVFEIYRAMLSVSPLPSPNIGGKE